MKRLFTGLLVCLLAGVALLLFFSSKKNPAPPDLSSTTDAPITRGGSSPAGSPPGTPPGTPANSSPPAAAANPPSSDAASIQPQDLSAKAGERPPDTNAPAVLPPEIVLQNVRRAVHQYGAMFGGNPVGTNPEITAALSGKNPRQINFLNGQAGMRVNENGELVDPWGTPYFFHQLSGTEMEIHSAGPDKVMWTSDDLVTK